MTSPSPPELFPQRPVRSDFGRTPSYRTRRIVTVLVLLLCLGGAVRWIFGGPSGPPGEVPTIAAEGSWKQRPQQPGGIDIPHQDVQVYQALDGTDANGIQVEHLLPPPETPQPVPTASAPPMPVPPKLEIENFSSPKPELAAEAAPPIPAPVPAPVAAVAPPEAKPVEARPPAAATSPAPQPVKAVPALAPAAKIHSAKTKSPTMEQVLKDTRTTATAGHAVQLASLQGEAAAQQMLEKLQGQYASVLGSTSLRLVKANLGAKGIYYRIQSAALSDDEANGICSALKKMKAGCILVRP